MVAMRAALLALTGVELALTVFIIYLLSERQWYAIVGFTLLLCVTFFAKGFLQEMERDLRDARR
jgi:hypothetical protein